MQKNKNKGVEVTNYISIKIEEDNMSSIFCSPLSICENCKHWSGSTCDVIKYGCNFIKKT